MSKSNTPTSLVETPRIDYAAKIQDLSGSGYYNLSLQPGDVEVIETVLAQFKSAGKVKVLEVGLLIGSTSRGMKIFCDENGIALDSWGMDIRRPDYAGPCVCPPFPGATFVQADSAEGFHLVPDDFDVVMIDGCHCLNHVILDTVHYSRKVKPGGFVLFHDTDPRIQQTMPDPHGPRIPEFSNSVLAAWELIGWPFRGWTKFMERGISPEAKFGGTTAFKKE